MVNKDEGFIKTSWRNARRHATGKTFRNFFQFYFIFGIFLSACALWGDKASLVEIKNALCNFAKYLGSVYIVAVFAIVVASRRYIACPNLLKGLWIEFTNMTMSAIALFAGTMACVFVLSLISWIFLCGKCVYPFAFGLAFLVALVCCCVCLHLRVLHKTVKAMNSTQTSTTKDLPD